MGETSHAVVRKLCLYLADNLDLYTVLCVDDITAAIGVDRTKVLTILYSLVGSGLVRQEGVRFMVTPQGMSWVSSVAAYALLVQLREQVAGTQDLVLKIARDRRLL